MMNKFENAKIYKIVDNVSDMVYIGSTCKTLQQRLKNMNIISRDLSLEKLIMLQYLGLLKIITTKLNFLNYTRVEAKRI